MRHNLLISLVGLLVTFTPVLLSAQDTPETALLVGSPCNFSYSDTRNTKYYSNIFEVDAGTNEVFYKLVLVSAMNVTISHCDSEVEDTYLYLLNSNQEIIGEANYSGTPWGTPCYFQAQLTKKLNPGTYYIVSEGYSENGVITTTITGELSSRSAAIETGSYSADFNYTDTRNSSNFTNADCTNPTNEIYYKFVTTNTMDIMISHCGSAIPDTYVALLDANYKEIASNDYTSIQTRTDGCTQNQLAFIKKDRLPAGTYYVRSEGKTQNGNITTTIKGNLLPNIINLGNKSSSFTYNNTVNTSDYTNTYTGRSTKDVLYKFTITRPMDIEITHSGSKLSATCIYLLEEPRYHVASAIETNKVASLRKSELEPGTYYVVSEGYSQNGIITTQIKAELSNNHNYVSTIIPLAETANISTLATKERMITRQYFDGLGRPNQTVQVGASTNDNDIVSMQEYDNYGRPDKLWLPTSISNNLGVYVADFSSFATKSHKDTNPYNKNIYEASPLNRILKELGPGEEWHTLSKGVTTEYLTNNQTVNQKVNYYYVHSAGHLVKSGTYATGELYVTLRKDEDNKQVYEFTDKLGRTILQRRILNNENVDTYLVYDDFGNLRYVLPPLAADALTSNTTYKLSENDPLKLYAYYYRYDGRNRCIEKKLPGIEPIRMTYNCYDLLVSTQTGNQREKDLWTVNKYDALGRLVYTCEVKDKTNFDILKDSIANWKFVETFSTGTHKNPMEKTGYSRDNYSTASTRLLTVYYYDNYDFVNLLPTKIRSAVTYVRKNGFDEKTDKTKTLLTGKLVYMLDNPNEFIATAYYYNERGKVIMECSNNLSDGNEFTRYLYDFTGNVIKSDNSFTTPSTGSEMYEYTYDHANRLITTKYQWRSSPAYIMAENNYDALGRLYRKRFHNNSHRVDYSYNIRGWLTQIKSQGGTNRFEQNIYYNTNPLNTSPYYNGNISMTTWKYNNRNNAYQYYYDHLNRLTDARDREGIQNFESGPNSETFTYDKQGNIKTLTRVSSSIFTAIDALSYTYNGNQITQINDKAGSQNRYDLKEYQGVYSRSTKIEYDKNGNLNKDPSRDIFLITYNLLNLPDTVQFTNGNQIINRYMADGRKIRTDYITLKTPMVSPVTGICKWRYSVDPINQFADIFSDNRIYRSIYHDDGIEIQRPRINTPEGFIYVVGNGSRSTADPYYYIKDYLGNIRETVTADGVVEQKLQYYPSGVPWFQTETMENQPFKFGGKEFIEMHGYDKYDFMARIYDPMIFSFMQIDPLAEKYYGHSPYGYCGGNPVRYVDPTGMFYHGYEIDEKGYMKRINDEGREQYDVIYNKSKYSESNRKEYNETGDKIGIKISKGIIQSEKALKFPTVNDDGDKVDNGPVNHLYKVATDEEALNIMNFMEKNTTVEWGNISYSHSSGSKGNILHTSHQENTITGAFRRVSSLVRNGFSIIRDDHIHPSGNPEPSGKKSNSSRKGDTGYKENVLEISPRAKFRILANGKYYEY